MPPVVALTLTLGFILFALRWEVRRSQAVVALWLPVIWIFLVGSRFVGQWLAFFGLMASTGSSSDGSPLDAVVFLLLILAGMWVLSRRGVKLSTVASNNAWMIAFLAYCVISILWSDFPLIAFRRWIKIIGHPVMALVIMTDENRVAALKTVLRRCAYIHVSLSILFIKYYPAYGRGFDDWTGQPSNLGINLNKNELGYACLIFGLFFYWSLVTARKHLKSPDGRIEFLVAALSLCGVWWLLAMAGSATALSCTVLGISVMAFAGSRLVSVRFIGTYLIVTVIVLFASEANFGLYARALEFLGRNATLTDRTAVWADVLAVDINPVLGAGFESFWLGPRLEALWAKWWWHPNQAHNGYIETYLNLGYIGLFILAGWIFATFRKCRAELLRDRDLGRYRLAMLIVVLAYNYTEATFKGVHVVWTLFFIISVDYPLLAQVSEVAKTVTQAPPLRWATTRPVIRPLARRLHH